MSTASTVLIITGAVCAPLTVLVLWRSPPWRWKERIERDSPAGYYEVTRGRNTVFLILFIWIFGLGLFATVADVIAWIARR